VHVADAFERIRVAKSFSKALLHPLIADRLVEERLR
jgi:hypothetical protein